MEKSEFEKRIAARAEERFDEGFKELVMYINNHPIGSRLKIVVDGKEITLANFGTNYGLMNATGLQNSNAKLTNLETVRSKMLEEYRQKEIDEILSKLDNFSYLFNQR